MDGKEIEIALSDLDANELLASLTPYIRRMTAVIEWYTGANACGEGVALAIARLLHEIAYNAFKHGRATCVRIVSGPTKITLVDDGRPYDIANLPAEPEPRGGATAFDALFDAFGRGGVVTVSYLPDKGIPYTIGRTKVRGNRYEFDLAAAAGERVDARHDCCADFAFERMTITPVIREGCDDVFIDMKSIESYSGSLSLLDSFPELIGKEKVLYVYAFDRAVANIIRKRFAVEIQERKIRLLPTNEV